VSKDDERNKSVVYDGRLSWAFTGLAQIGKEPSEKWLADQLFKINRKNQSLCQIAETLSNRATLTFRGIRLDSFFKRHAFVAIGWWPKDNSDIFESVIVLISNATDENNCWRATANDFFSAKIIKPTNKLTIIHSGQNIPNSRLHRLHRTFQASIKKGALHAAGELLVREVQVISQTNSMVGNTVMLTSLPKSALQKTGDFSFINSKPSNNIATYWYYSSSEVVQKSPIVVGTSMMSDIVVSRGADEAQRKTFQQKFMDLARPRFLILTPWTGTGQTSEDSRRGLVTEYEHTSWTNISNPLSWDKEYDCPYFGLVAAIDTSESIINEIKKDNRHVFLADTNHPMEDPPPEELVVQLLQWFRSNGAIEEEIDSINLEGHRETIRTLVNRVLLVTRSLRRGHEETKLHPPPSGSGAGVMMTRKHQSPEIFVPDSSPPTTPKNSISLTRISQFCRSAEQQALQGNISDARETIDNALDLISDRTSEAATNMKVRLLWTKANTYSVEKRAIKMELYEECVEILSKLSKLDGSSVEIFVKSQSALACEYASQGDREKSSELFNYVYQTTKEIISQSNAENITNYFAPLCYLWSAKNNLAVWHLTSGEHYETIRVLVELFSFMNKISLDLSQTWKYEEISKKFGNKNANILSLHIVKSLRNLCLAYYATGEIDKARGVFLNLIQRFNGISEKKVHETINYIKNLIK
jgi:HPt (histidine-containing phosphotransfer) domain-containing protein